MNVMNILGRITEDIMALEVMESHSEIVFASNATVSEINVREMNRAYDALIESTMELFHDTQERRRAYNRAVRESRHQQRLAAQRERSQQARAIVQNIVDLTVPAPAPSQVSGLTKLKTKALKKTELNAQMPDSCGICLEVNTRANSIETDCGHGFCKACFDEYIDSIRSKPQAHRNLNCPMCRKFGPKCTEFRPRKTPTKKPKTQEPVTNQEVDELANMMTGITI
jgi:hypothetical protein